MILQNGRHLLRRLRHAKKSRSLLGAAAAAAACCFRNFEKSVSAHVAEETRFPAAAHLSAFYLVP